ncbi:MAG: carboxypeptidase-like regulatory domain-containing protein [Planctomycetota bacterium]
MRCVPRDLWLVALPLVVCLALRAQHTASTDPDPRQQVVLVRDAETGLPLPGVRVRLGRVEREAPYLVDGWLQRFGIRPTTPRVVRSDPAGRLVLRGADAQAPVEFGPDFARVEELTEQDQLVWVVQRTEHHAVLVVDAAGKSVPDFAVRNERTGEVEVSDEFGVARFSRHGMFRMLPLDSHDATFVPAHWIGPIAAPVRATAGRARMPRLQLPPQGTLRLRFLRHGVPTPVAIDAAWLTAPAETSLWSARPELLADTPFAHRIEPVTCRGIEVGPIGWPGEVRGEVQIGRLRLPFAGTAQPGRGSVLNVDLETDPPRPRLLGRVRTDGGPVPMRVRVGVLTDAGGFEDETEVGPDGRFSAGFDVRWLRGTELRAVWIDAFVGSLGAAAERTVTGPLHGGAIELGDFSLVPHAPVVRGRVVDSRGQPLPQAQVTVLGPSVDGGTVERSLVADADGRFVLTGPWFRDAHGAIAPASAFASLPWVRPVSILPVHDPRCLASPRTPASSDFELVVPDLATGACAVVVLGAPVSWRSQLQARVVVQDGELALHDEHMVRDRAAGAWQRGLFDVPAGRARLRIACANHLIHEQEVEILPTRPSDQGGVQVLAFEFDELVRQRSVRAVDRDGRHVPEARLHLRTAGHRSGVMPDERGALVWLAPLALPHAAYLVAPGKQILALDANVAGDVVLSPAVPVGLRLPVASGEALAGAWTVMLDPCDELGLAVYGPLRGDVVEFPGPAPGRYHVAMFARFEQFSRRVRLGTVEIAGDRAVPATLPIDAEARAALQVLQQEPPLPKR